MNIETSNTHNLKNMMTMTHRNLLKTLHNPDNFGDVIMEPVIFTLLFGFLFGGAIAGSVQAYLPILVPGILIQSILNAASGSGQQLREDINNGVFARFKTLPIAPIVPLAGQLIGDIFRLLVAGSMALITAFLMGWRPVVDLPMVAAALGLALFIGWATSWIFALVGLVAKNAEMIGSLSMMIILVLTFLSNAFVPTKTLPRFIQTIVNLNPVSYTVTAIRSLLLTGTWNLHATVALLCGLLIISIFMPLSLMAYQKQN